MSASLLRLQDGRLGCIFCVKRSLQWLTPYWSVSSDEGKTWSTPNPVTPEKGYFVVNNDRLIQHSDGTLILPYALHLGFEQKEQYEQWDPALNARCGLFYSRDGGHRWECAPHYITHTPELFHPPLHMLQEEALSPRTRYQLERKLGVFQEPGVQELADGSLMLYMRSNYAIYRCFAAGGDQPWKECSPIEGFHVCVGPHHPAYGRGRYRTVGDAL